ncbi:MAG: type VI secretion system baseplate subunit TssF [Rhodobacteraceae bacterium]|nr:type VI secretion system baseplate subunit TssF [Paracoccaceae bacterium]
MDTRILKKYEEELAFMREMGEEFAEAYPKIASRLGMDGVEIKDPYVERMMEGFAFMAARVQLELDLQYPVLTQHLLEIIYPHYLAPTPSMFIAQFMPDAAQGGMDEGFLLKRGTPLRSPLRDGDTTSCRFRTAHDVTLWPIEIVEAEYLDGRGEVVAAGVGENRKVRAAIRLRIKATGEVPLSKLPIEDLTLYMTGVGWEPWRLYEHIVNDSMSVAGKSTNRRAAWVYENRYNTVEAVGYDPEQALLPFPGQSFDGYRLLQEYYALPNRFFFSKLGGLKPIFQRAGDEKTVDIFILLSQSVPELKPVINPEAFELFASPAINLFEKRCDRVHVSGRDVDYHIVPDRTAPLDYEIYEIKKVRGISGEGQDDVDFEAFYSSNDFTAAGEAYTAYYSLRRRMHQRSERQRIKGTRTSYLGADVFVNLVDQVQAPYRGDVEQLSVQATCTNRDLPMLLPIGTGDTDFDLPDGGPVKSVNALTPITRPRASLAIEGDSAWRLISHLSLNYLSISDTDRGEPAAALRELLGIYGPLGDKTLAKQLEGITKVWTRPIVRRMADEILSTAVRGLEVNVEFDESFYEGTGVYVLGAVLQRFFAKYVSVNSFTETVIHSPDRGEIARWPATSGTRRVI